MKILRFNKSIYRQFVFIFIVSCCLTVTVSAQETSSSAVEDASLHVTSDRMIAKRDSAMVEFIGNVEAVRLDAVITADSIKVFFNQDDDKEAGKAETDAETPQSHVKKIIATGNVVYTSEDRRAEADKAVYTADDEVLVLTGKAPKLITGKNYVVGKKITLFRQEDQVVVESDSTKRVEALFIPENESE